MSKRKITDFFNFSPATRGTPGPRNRTLAPGSDSESAGEIDSDPTEIQVQSNSKLSATTAKTKRVEVKKFSTGWLKSFPWLRYDQGDKCMFCAACRKAGRVGVFTDGTRNFRMSHPLYPKFRRDSRSQLLLTDSMEGRRAAAARPAWSPPLSAAANEKQAQDRVTSRQGDLSDEQDVLGEYILQSGKYRGKGFRWLLENVPGYVGRLVGEIIAEVGKEDTSSQHQKANKMSFKRYVELFEEGREIILLKRKEKSDKASSAAPGVSKFQSLLAGRELPARLLQHRVKALCSTSKVKPNIPSTVSLAAAAVVPHQPATAHETFTEGSETFEDRELADFLEAVEATDHADVSGPLLYQGWKKTLPEVDHHWVSKAFFRINPSTNRIEFRSEQFSQLWHSPPPAIISPSARNRVNRYFSHKLFLWMPVNMWGVRILCPHTDDTGECKGVLTRAGIHQKTRMVLDLDCHYIIAAEYLRCSSCGRKVVSWAHNVLSQLDIDRQLMFPCVLAAKLACDKRVVRMLRNRGLGNSISQVCKKLQEEHGDAYYEKCHHFLAECRRFAQAAQTGLLIQTQFEDPPEMMAIPGHRWLMKVYQLDVLQRLQYIKAAITSQFGRVLKIDSTKKITKNWETGHLALYEASGSRVHDGCPPALWSLHEKIESLHF